MTWPEWLVAAAPRSPLVVGILVQTTLLAAAVLVVAQVFRRHAALRHSVLLGGLLGVAALPIFVLLESPLHVVRFPIPDAVSRGGNGQAQDTVAARSANSVENDTLKPGAAAADVNEPTVVHSSDRPSGTRPDAKTRNTSVQGSSDFGPSGEFRHESHDPSLDRRGSAPFRPVNVNEPAFVEQPLDENEAEPEAGAPMRRSSAPSPRQVVERNSISREGATGPWAGAVSVGYVIWALGVVLSWIRLMRSTWLLRTARRTARRYRYDAAARCWLFPNSFKVLVVRPLPPACCPAGAGFTTALFLSFTKGETSCSVSLYDMP